MINRHGPIHCYQSRTTGVACKCRSLACLHEYSQQVSLAGFRGRPWMQMPQSLVGQILPSTQLFHLANPR